MKREEVMKRILFFQLLTKKKKTNHNSFFLCCHIRSKDSGVAAVSALQLMFSSVFPRSLSGLQQLSVTGSRGHSSPLVNNIFILLIVTVSSLVWFEPTRLTDGALPPK